MTQSNFVDPKGIAGRGLSEAARLSREWFAELTELAKGGGTAAYCFVNGNLIEILRTFDIPVTFPEINSLQTAFRNVSRSYLDEAEDYGYSPDICGYVKIGVAIQLRNGAHPMGQIPKPKLALLNNSCNTFIKWGEIWERSYDAPVYSIDYPMTRSAGTASVPGSAQFKYEQKYLLGQMHDVIKICEEVTGKKFDIDRFRQVLSWSNDVNLSWKRIVDLNKTRPAVFNALTDGTVYLGAANALRGTEAGSKFFKELVEEMEYRAANGIGVLEKTATGVTPNKQDFRLALVGTPCYPIHRQFNDMFSKWGGVFVYSSYLNFASSGALANYEYDLKNPLESYSEGQLIMHSSASDSMMEESHNLKRSGPEFGIDGVVFHPVKSCRTVSTGMADMRRVVADDQGLPTLFLESDLVDPQVVSAAQMRNRADAFFEGLISRRQQKQSA
jgi:benzoyl-CoA reductase subunit B